MTEPTVVEEIKYSMSDLLKGVTTRKEFKHFKDALARTNDEYTLRNVEFKWDNCTIPHILELATREVKTRVGQSKKYLGSELSEILVSPPGVRASVDPEAAYLAKHGGDLDKAIADLMAKKAVQDAITEKAVDLEEFKKTKNAPAPKRGE